VNPVPASEEADFIWATRGRTWGFRFLRRAGLDDPLRLYESAFSALADESEGWVRNATTVALRFRDPDGRRDQSGRVIAHDFVLLGERAQGIDSLDAGRRRIWPIVAPEFAVIWDLKDPSSGSA
jgi:hypothetical protein